jgi:hypothetical protein
VMGFCDRRRAWSTRVADVPSRVTLLCWCRKLEYNDGSDIDGSIEILTSSESCCVASDNCSKHS